MTQIDIPFRGDMARAVRERRKICTSRTTRRGNVGDRFIVGTVECELTGVEKLPLSHVASHFYRFEGFETPDDFKRVWSEIHPMTGFDPDNIVWVHFFKVVEPSE